MAIAAIMKSRDKEPFEFDAAVSLKARQIFTRLRIDPSQRDRPGMSVLRRWFPQ
jgi:hypothetical protein